MTEWTKPSVVEITSAEEIRRLLETRRREIGVTKRAVSLKAGFAHCAYWVWQNGTGKITLEAALCYLRALGYRVHLTQDEPLVKKTGKAA